MWITVNRETDFFHLILKLNMWNDILQVYFTKPTVYLKG